MTFVYAQSEKFSVSYDQHLKVYQSTFLLKVQSKFKPSKSNISSSLLTELDLADNKLLIISIHFATSSWIKAKLEKHMNSPLLKKWGFFFFMMVTIHVLIVCVCVCVCVCRE